MEDFEMYTSLEHRDYGASKKERNTLRNRALTYGFFDWLEIKNM